MKAPRKRRYNYRFSPRQDARIVELRVEGLTHIQTAKALGLSRYLVTERITYLETLAKTPGAKVRQCIRPKCTTEFVSLSAGHRVCGICKHSEISCEPFGDFPVVMA